VRTLLSGLTLKSSSPAVLSATKFFTPTELRSHELSHKSSLRLDFTNSPQFDLMGGTGSNIWQPNCSYIYGVQLLVNIGLNPGVGISINGSVSGCGCGSTPTRPYPVSDLSSLTSCAAPGAANTSHPLCALAAYAMVAETDYCYCQWQVEVARTGNLLESQFVSFVALFLSTGNVMTPTCCGAIPLQTGQKCCGTELCTSTGGNAHSSSTGACIKKNADGTYVACGAFSLHVNHVLMVFAIVAAWFSRRV